MKEYTSHIRLFGFSIWAHYYHKRFGWFRLFGRGLKWKDTTIHKLMFSERNGYSKGIDIGVWRISYVPYSKLTGIV